MLAVTAEELPVLVIMELIITVEQVFRKVLENFEADIIRDNFSGVLLTIDELIEHGCPFTAQRHVLEYFLKPKSLLDKIQAAFTKKNDNYLEESIGNEQLLDSPWRPRRIKYTINEVLIDVIEYVNCIMDKQGNFIRYDITGEVSVASYLSGMPDLSMIMHCPHQFSSYFLHPSAISRRKRFEQEKVVCFVPPDGKFVALKYVIDDLAPTLPLRVNSNMTFNPEEAKLDLKVESKMIGSDRYPVDAVKIEIHFPPDVDSPVTNVSLGNYKYQDGIGTWDINRLVLDRPSVFGATFTAPDMERLKYQQISVFVQFQVISLSLSQTRVEKLTSRGENYAPYKGARTLVRAGNFEVRVN